jgi:hypothetical protein
MKNSFLYQLCKQDRKLFFGILVCGILHIGCNITGFQITPFFVWGMYSAKEKSPESYPVFTVSSPTDTLSISSGYSDNTRFYLQAPLLFANEYAQGQDEQQHWWEKHAPRWYKKGTAVHPSYQHPPSEWNQFTRWHARYIHRHTSLNYPIQVTVQQVAIQSSQPVSISPPSILWHADKP